MKILLVLLAVSASATAAHADLLRCRTIADAAQRVACYDAIPVATTPTPAAAAPAKAVTTSAPTLTAGADNFGLSARQLRPSGEPDEIHSTLLGRIDGWGPTTQFRLANGQIWRVSDDSTGNVPEIDHPHITISRNALGTLFLEIEGSKQAPRVRRLQ